MYNHLLFTHTPRCHISSSQHHHLPPHSSMFCEMLLHDVCSSIVILVHKCPSTHKVAAVLYLRLDTGCSLSLQTLSTPHSKSACDSCTQHDYVLSLGVLLVCMQGSTSSCPIFSTVGLSRPGIRPLTAHEDKSMASCWPAPSGAVQPMPRRGMRCWRRACGERHTPVRPLQ